MTPLSELLTFPLRFREDGRASVLLRCRDYTAARFRFDALLTSSRPGVPSRYARSRPGVFHRYRIATPEIYPCGRNHVAWCFALSATHIQADLRLVADLLEDSGQPWIGITNRYGNCLIPRPELIRHRVRNAA